MAEETQATYDVPPTPSDSPALRHRIVHGVSVASQDSAASIHAVLSKLLGLKAGPPGWLKPAAAEKSALSRQASTGASQLFGLLLKRVKKRGKAPRWLRRFFVLKEGFLLYYTERELKAFETSQQFNSHPKGLIPLGGSIVEPSQEADHKHSIFIDHEAFPAPIILAAASERDQDAWISRIREASKLTVRNARLGESMIEALESQGLRLTKERQAYAERLQTEVAALRDEMDKNEELTQVKDGLEAEKVKLEATTEELKSDLIQVKAELELTVQLKQTLEQEKLNLNAKTEHLQAKLDGLAIEKVRVEQQLDAKEHEKERLSHENQVYSKRTSDLRQQLDSIAEKTRQLQLEKRDIQEKLTVNESRALDLEEEKDYYSHSAKELMASLSDLSVQKEMTEAELRDEVMARVKAEKALRSAEKALENLEMALKLSGHHSAFAEQMMPDVHLLKKFFEDCAEEARLDANRPVIMKNAVYARKSFLRRSTKGRRSRRRSDAAVVKRLSSHIDEMAVELAATTKPQQPDLINFH